jgi:hypothetical protein
VKEVGALVEFARRRGGIYRDEGPGVKLNATITCLGSLYHGSHEGST